MRRAWTFPLILRRCLHQHQNSSSNLYTFYDLTKQQPKFTFDPLASMVKESMSQRVKQAFGTPGSREASREEQIKHTRVIAGVKLYAKPDEPTNCCQSGCINCVWDLYREELDEWKAQKRDVIKALLQKADVPWPSDFGPEPAGRRTGNVNFDAVIEREQDDMNKSIEVFVETERKLRQRKEKQRQAQAQAQAQAQNNR